MTGRRYRSPRFPGLVALAACTLLLLPAAASAQSTHAPAELDIPAYEVELGRIAESLRDTEQIPQLRKSLPRAWTVRVGDQSVQVPTGWLASDLKKIEEDPANSPHVSQEVTSRLVAMRNMATALEHGSSPANLDVAHTKIDKILSAREFGAAQGPSQWDLLKARIARWVGLQIYKLLSRLHLGAKAGNALAWIIVGVAFLALVYWVWKTLSPKNRRPATSVEVATESSDQRHWALDALAAADRGDYREAVHCAYWAAVVHLEALGVLKRDRARTPRESLRLLDPHPNEQDLLREFTRRFELIWYGYRPASANDWSEARSNLEKMGCLTPSTPATVNS
jgi:hypothetical protein